MFDTSKLRGRIVEKFGTLKRFCEVAEISYTYASRYLNGKVQLSQEMIKKWTEVLEIPKEEVGVFFFDHILHEM